MNVKQAYQECERVIAENSRTFYKAFSLLPKADRLAVWAVYAFCRRVDDLVDEGLNPVTSLREFEQEFQNFLDGRYDEADPMWLALADVFKRYDMDPEPFKEQLKGQEMDLTNNRYKTMDDLLVYCYHVASTVGLMLLPILAPTRQQELKEDAITLGLAMQLTNILRDVGEDLNRGRIYMPTDRLAHFEVSEWCMRKGVISEGFIRSWEELAVQAEAYYDQANRSIHFYPKRSQIPLKSASHFYRHILSTIREKDYRVFDTKHFVSDERKAEILAVLQ
ncbi:phytoene/squalene synthase family protein [Chryseomicrobium sp. FSL W7-1435]|uniref:phytoene/squalene synthase family protein n=1 Tax=Chryseomicrobium sp. FSL W7-1435 TaxID=2921704 RepID=UPI003159FA72